MEDNKNNETEQVTEQVKANAKPSASEKKDAKDKEVVMVCEYIEKGDYYIYHPEQCMAQNDNNLVFLSENGIKIEAFFNESESLDIHYQNGIKYNEEHGWNTTYKHRSKTGYFLSGKNSDGIIYYHTIRIEYPESEKDFGDQYIKYYIKRFPEQI